MHKLLGFGVLIVMVVLAQPAIAASSTHPNIRPTVRPLTRENLHVDCKPTNSGWSDINLKGYAYAPVQCESGYVLVEYHPIFVQQPPEWTREINETKEECLRRRGQERRCHEPWVFQVQGNGKCCRQGWVSTPN